MNQKNAYINPREWMVNWTAVNVLQAILDEQEEKLDHSRFDYLKITSNLSWTSSSSALTSWCSWINTSTRCFTIMQWHLLGIIDNQTTNGYSFSTAHFLDRDVFSSLYKRRNNRKSLVRTCCEHESAYRDFVVYSHWWKISSNENSSHLEFAEVRCMWHRLEWYLFFPTR